MAPTRASRRILSGAICFSSTSTFTATPAAASALAIRRAGLLSSFDALKIWPAADWTRRASRMATRHLLKSATLLTEVGCTVANWDIAERDKKTDDMSGIRRFAAGLRGPRIIHR